MVRVTTISHFVITDASGFCANLGLIHCQFNKFCVILFVNSLKNKTEKSLQSYCK